MVGDPTARQPIDDEFVALDDGTMRVDVRTTGERAHAARSWKGVNAIHLAAPVLARLNDYVARQPEIDGLTYHETRALLWDEQGGIGGPARKRTGSINRVDRAVDFVAGETDCSAGRRAESDVADDWIANEAAARKMGWGDDAVGKKVKFFHAKEDGQVIGLVKDF